MLATVDRVILATLAMAAVRSYGYQGVSQGSQPPLYNIYIYIIVNKTCHPCGCHVFATSLILKMVSIGGYGLSTHTAGESLVPQWIYMRDMGFSWPGRQPPLTKPHERCVGLWVSSQQWLILINI